MLLGVEKLRRDARDAFANTISGTDLVVGARSGSVQLLLYSVFRIGAATNNISWESYQEVRAMPRVKWAVPVSLGDSHRGFRVMGTTQAYFEHYRYARQSRLRLASGRIFDGPFDAVIGSQVTASLGYAAGTSIVIAHGSGRVSLIEHDDKLFTVTGGLAPNGTPVDRTVHVSLAAIEALHLGWKDGAKRQGFALPSEESELRELKPKAVTALLLGLDSKIAIFGLQRRINDFPREPLLAILPGVALQELWDLMSVAEGMLRVVSAMVVVTGMLGMLTMVLSSLKARRREMAVLRSVGARPVHVCALFMSEAVILAGAGAALGLTLLYLAIGLGRGTIARDYGLHIPLTPPNASDLLMLGAVVLVACLVGCVPAIRAYRMSLSDGLSIRI